ncbi:MAG: hypothetical protein JF611_03530 [Betaproteobacteria bacterium]|nr:hypothetical protein [Betaproteobacteria bacterium]
MLLGVIDEDVADAERGEAEEREPAMLFRAEAQRQPANQAPGEEQRRGEEKAVCHAHLGRHRAELERDRDPGGAPDRDARDEVPR